MCECCNEKVKQIKVERISEKAILPEITEGNAGIDLRLLTDGESVTIQPNGTHIFHTGIKIELPIGYYVEVHPRSSTGIKSHLRLMNTIGIIDNPYRGELLVALHNFGYAPITIENNQRVCQMIIKRDETKDFTVVEGKVNETTRGEGGIGSTGKF